VNSDTDKAVAIVNFLVSRGHSVDFERPDSVVIKPMPEKRLVDRIMANETIITAMLSGLDERPATSHTFVVGSRSADVSTAYAMCLACGIPWACHGEPPRASWAIVDDVDSVRIRECAPLPVACECGVVAA
jgi:hypothetical protein